MGQYYKFINKTRNEESRIALPFNFGLPWAKSLENYSNDEVEAMFRFVIQYNAGWQSADEVVAIGDYGAVIAYHAVQSQRKGFAWESYQPAKVPPQKLAPPNQQA